MTKDPTIKLAEAVVKYVATNMYQQSALLYPPGLRGFEMSDPYGLLDLIKEKAGVDEDLIDTWMCEAQGIEK